MKVRKHRFFWNKGFDVYCEVPIDKKQAKKGTKVRVKTIYGNTVELNVPAKTRDNRTFRLKGMGIKSNHSVGDQYIKINVN